ncbi:MAG: type II secretion system protein [Desulfuromonadales bacterium]|nr:type II secretion system protein [Desulfuromonadales bacterium]
MPMRYLSSQRGMTLFTVLLAVVVIGLMLSLTGQTWSQVMQREREAELLFRGDQYRRAIESYYTTGHGGVGIYPRTVEDLLKDPRSLQTKRHLRKAYLDPFSNAEFELIAAGGDVGGETVAVQSLGRIKGVRSTSTLPPFRQDGFPEEYENFKGAASYDKWEFTYTPKSALPPQTEKLLPVPDPPVNP